MCNLTPFRYLLCQPGANHTYVDHVYCMYALVAQDNTESNPTPCINAAEGSQDEPSDSEWSPDETSDSEGSQDETSTLPLGKLYCPFCVEYQVKVIYELTKGRMNLGNSIELPVTDLVLTMACADWQVLSNHTMEEINDICERHQYPGRVNQ